MTNPTKEWGKNHRLTRKQRRELGRQIRSEKPGLDVVHPDAAGIDIGSREHYVAVGPDRDGEPVRVFGCFTSDLQRLADFLTQCRIKTVVMQSTGVYWIPVYDVLEEKGELFIVMEYVDATAMRRCLKPAGMDMADVATAVRQIGAALSA